MCDENVYLSSFQKCNTVLLTLVTRLNITYPELTYLVAGSFYLWITFTHFTHLTFGNRQSAFFIYEFSVLKFHIYVKGFPSGSAIKNLPAMQETWVWSQDWEDPPGKEMATHSRILAWKIPWAEEPGRLLFIGLLRVRHSWAHMYTYMWNAIFVFLYLTSLSIIPSRPTSVATNGKISFFLWLNNMPLCTRQYTF